MSLTKSMSNDVVVRSERDLNPNPIQISLSFLTHTDQLQTTDIFVHCFESLVQLKKVYL